MRCEFCGELVKGSPIRMDGDRYCSLDCANMASEIEGDSDSYLDDEEDCCEEDGLDMEVYDYDE